jgi:two-component system chemotaxis sensor kinase CheA
MDGILRDFVVETTESLDVVDLELVRFEQDPNNRAIIAQIFRLVHTIKGTCGFLGLPRLEALAHAAETVIDRFRDGAPVTRDAVTLILQTIDRIKLIIAALERTEAEPPGEDQDLITALETLDTTKPKLPHLQLVDQDQTIGHLTYQVLERKLRPGEVSLDELERAFRATPGPDTLQTSQEAQGHTVGNLTYQVLERPLRPGEATLDELEEAFRATPGPAPVSAPARQIEAPTPARNAPVSPTPVSVQRAQDSSPDAEASRAPPEAPIDGAEPSVAKQSVRVSINTLEHLMTMVSELVLTRNQLLEIARREQNNDFKVPLQRLSHVTAELQESIMKTRMQHVGASWAKLPRLIRDLSQETGKDLDLITYGAETEIDRQVLELIRDPMVHMIRNCADHGIEPASERVAKGKPAKGTITVGASQEGGHILLQIKDDGRGLNLERIRAKAIARGLTTHAAADNLSDAQIAKFIFEPGFSTAETVTSISGRGVGMDVVRTNIEQIGGTIDISTREGLGTTISVKIPLTLAIAAALIVEAGGQRFALPQMSVVELVRSNTNADTRIDAINDAPVLRLRDSLVPLLPLAKRLGLKEIKAENSWSKSFIVICQVGRQRFGIVVDSVLHTEEVVVKPASSKLRHIPFYSGTTILGDGAVIMILDPNGLAGAVGALSSDQDEDTADTTNQEEEAATTSLLVFRAGGTGLKAVPLALVTRLEEIDVATIEMANGQPLVQYRGKLMQLVPANSNVAIRQEGGQPILVFNQGQRATGIVVDEIIDIVEDRLDIDLAGSAPGLVGSAIVRGRATDIIDVAHYLPQGEVTSGNDSGQVRKVLLVDPSDFFRSMLSPVIRAAGYRVVVSSSVADAANRLARTSYDAIIADIENDGTVFGLAEELAKDHRHAECAMIGLASRASPAVLSKARVAGFADVVGKFDREGLLASLHDLLDVSGEAA